MMEANGDNYELFFLIVKFLREGACPEAAVLLEKELTDPARRLLPPRLDWKGQAHPQTYQDLERQFPKVGPGHLASLASWITSIPRNDSVSLPRSLLSLPGDPRPRPRLVSTNQVLNFRQLGLTRRSLNTLAPLSSLSVRTAVYQRLALQRRTLGHLSAVFCLLFDKTGHFIFTGADDLLVKMWDTHTGRLYFTFRGASAEISDMAVSEDNRLLAAGSTDKIIRVWCLVTAAPVAVLSKHTGTITALHFCPCAAPGVPSYLAATSGDGTVSFWRYQYKDKTKRRTNFDPEPTRYHEKMRPGGAQMICAAFSPGGLFLATGSADHHVRVYMMDGKEGPGKVLEQEAHTERVDSIQWGNSPVLRFISGSKDGTARIWSFRGGHWNSAVLRMVATDGRSVHFNKEKNAEEPLRVTMVTWSCDDSRAITAVSDTSLCIWDPNTSTLLQRLQGHKDEVYVLEPHPTQPSLLMSGAHDGYLIIWDMAANKVLFRHHNMIEGQGHGAVYDAKWSPSDQLTIAASDSHGHLLFFGVNSPEARGLTYNQCPEEMFFHTDYRPLLRDTQHHVVDEQTQCAPHLLPPPFLVDVEGNPYPADIQRQVPGREHLSDKEALVPGGGQEQQEPPPASRPPAASPVQQARMSVDHQLQARSVDQQLQVQPASNIDALIAELAANTGTARPSAREALVAARGEVATAALSPTRGVATTGAREAVGSAPPALLEHSYAAEVRDGEGREREGARGPNQARPAAASQQLVSSVWRKRQLARPDLYRAEQSDLSRRREGGLAEKRLFKVEGAKRRHGSGHQGHHGGYHEGVSELQQPTREGGRGSRRQARTGRGGRTRGARPTEPPLPQPPAPPPAQESPDEGSDQDQSFHESSVTDSSLSESDMEGVSGTSSDSTEYSDWGDNNLTPPQRTARKSGKLTASSRPASSEEEQKQDRPGPSRYFKRKKYSFDPTNLEDIPPEYLPSPWLAEFIPKKTPYFPQMGDEVMYFKQGHMGYINLVKHRNCYKLNMREQQWLKRDDLRQMELVKVVGMKYDIRPPRLCCLKLAIMNPEDNELTGKSFSIKYHDMNDVVDFLVLRHNYEHALGVTWAVGDRYRCQIEDMWWYGSVIGVSPFDPNVPDSPFLSIVGLWDSGEEERLSPWDLDMVEKGEMEDQSPVSRQEIERHLYQPQEEEWRGLNHVAECKRISRGLEQVMLLAPAESFNYPVDLTLFPDYMLEIEYPMDFNLIKSRLDNQFYRRSTAVQFDVRYIATNAECYNRPKTDIVKFARILMDLVLRIIQDPSLDQDQVNREYHRLVDSFKWEDTQEPASQAKKKEETRKPSTGSTPGKSSSKESPNPKQWKHDCNELLNQMIEHPDSVPFREPVDEYEFPDYHRIITTPMDFTQIRESLRVGEYESPQDMHKDMMLMFSNSFAYNTDKKSEVLKMTKRMKASFCDSFHTIVTNWRRVNRKINFLKKKGKSPKTTPKSTPVKKTPSKQQRKKKEEKYETDESEEDYGAKTPSKVNGGKRKLSMDDESDSEEEFRPKNKGKGKGKGKGKSSKIQKDVVVGKDSKQKEGSESDDDIPISRRRNKPLDRTPKKKYLNLNGIKPSKKKNRNLLRQHIEEEDISNEESEEIEETPEESEEEDEHLIESPVPEKKSGKRKRIISESEEEELTSKARPKRSAQARVVKSLEEDSEELLEEKVPYKRRSIKTSTEEDPTAGPSGSGPSSGSSGGRVRGGGGGEGRFEEWSVRPRRMATEKALSKFQDETSSDPEDPFSSHKKLVSSRSPKKKKVGQSAVKQNRIRNQNSEQRRSKKPVETDSEEEQVQYSRKTKSKPLPPPPESEESDIEAAHVPLKPSRRTGGESFVSSSSTAVSAGVTISAADSSTDLARQVGMGAGPSSSTTLDMGRNSRVTVEPPEVREAGTSTSSRPQRKIVKPIRLQDYSDDDDIKEAKRKNGVQMDVSQKSDKKKKAKNRPPKNKEKRSSEKKKHRRSSDGRYQQNEEAPHPTDFMLSPKAKRQKKSVNYRDETDSMSEPSFPSTKMSPHRTKPPPKGHNTGSSEKREKRRSDINYKDESSGVTSEEDVQLSMRARKSHPIKTGGVSRKDPVELKSRARMDQGEPSSRGSRRKEPVRYEEYSYESGDIDDEEALVDILKGTQDSDESDSESGLTIKYNTGETEGNSEDETVHGDTEDRVGGLEEDAAADDSDDEEDAAADDSDDEEEAAADDSDDNLGRRRGSRTAQQEARGANVGEDRPQRSAGQSARHNFREESTDDDLPPKRHHRPKNSPRGGARGRGGLHRVPRPPSPFSEEEGEGVSSRGRVRRPNPRLSDD